MNNNRSALKPSKNSIIFLVRIGRGWYENFFPSRWERKGEKFFHYSHIKDGMEIEKAFLYGNKIKVKAFDLYPFPLPYLAFAIISW